MFSPRHSRREITRSLQTLARERRESSARSPCRSEQRRFLLLTLLDELLLFHDVAELANRVRHRGPACVMPDLDDDLADLLLRDSELLRAQIMRVVAAR